MTPTESSRKVNMVIQQRSQANAKYRDMFVEREAEEQFIRTEGLV